MRQDRFTDKVVLITGGGTGIGKACAVDFAKEGAIAIVSGRRESLLVETVNEIKGADNKADYFICDVANPNMVDEMLDAVVEKYGKIDIVVSNAGVVLSKPITETTNEEVDRLVDINVKGNYYVIRKSAIQMLKQGYGNIVGMSSMSGLIAHPNMTLYCSTKAAIANMVRALSLELATKNIRVNAVCPGTIETPMMHNILDTSENVEKRMEAFVEAEPMHRVATVDEVSSVVLFLASDEASFVTGSMYTVDGGFTAGK